MCVCVYVEGKEPKDMAIFVFDKFPPFLLLIL